MVPDNFPQNPSKDPVIIRRTKQSSNKANSLEYSANANRPKYRRYHNNDNHFDFEQELRRCTRPTPKRRRRGGRGGAIISGHCGDRCKMGKRFRPVAVISYHSLFISSEKRKAGEQRAEKVSKRRKEKNTIYDVDDSRLRSFVWMVTLPSLC